MDRYVHVALKKDLALGTHVVRHLTGGRKMAFALLLGLVSCGEGPPDRPIAYRGEYHYDSDSAYLVQVGVEARICIKGADMTPAVQPEFSKSGGISEVVVRGLLSRAGRYGPQGICTYELRSAELLGVGERRDRS